MIGKKLAGEKAATYIKPGMIVGLGTGSTVYYTIMKLGQLVKEGLEVVCVSTSNESTKLAKGLGINVVPFNEVKYVDLTIDGADEVDKNLDGIKGGGGALLFEKLVASVSKEIIWVVDESKLVETLGEFKLPIEVVKFSYDKVIEKLKKKGYKPLLRMTESNDIYITDDNNYILDLEMKRIENPVELNKELKLISGVIETGLFTNMANKVIVGYKDSIKEINK